MNKELNESLVKSLFDNAAVFEIIRRLSTPFDQTKAFKLNLIDAQGNLLKKRRDMTPQERSALTLFDLMLFNLKKLMAQFTHSANLAPLAASVLLLKESIEQQQDLTETEINKIVHSLCRDFVNKTEYMMYLESEAPVNVSNPGVNTSATLPVTNIAYPDNVMEPPLDPEEYEMNGLKVYRLNKKHFAKLKKRRQMIKESKPILVLSKDTNERYLIVS